MIGHETTAKGQRNPVPRCEPWAAGRYVLIADAYTSPPDWRERRRGNALDLDAETATRLGNAGAIASAGPEGGS